MENRRKFLDEMKRKYDIKEPKDWRKMKKEDFKDAGGITLLHHYNTSIFQCLQSVYKGVEFSIVFLMPSLEISWKREWFPNLKGVPYAYWTKLENRKEFLDRMKIKFGISEPKDWGKVTVDEICKEGGSSLLLHFKWSLFQCLQSVYKGSNDGSLCIYIAQKFSGKKSGFQNCQLFQNIIGKRWKIEGNS